MTSELQTARPGLGRRCPPRRAAVAIAVVDTKIIYHLDNQEKLLIPAERVTLGDFKALLNWPNYKLYFKSTDDDFGQESDGVECPEKERIRVMPRWKYVFGSAVYEQRNHIDDL